MRTINKDDLDIINLKHIYTSEDAKTYRDDDTVYKLFEKPEDVIAKDHAVKARIMNRYRRYLDKHIILPKEMIVCSSYDAGYTSKYVKNSTPLYNFQINSPAALKQFYYYLYDICKLLKNLHNTGIVVSDFHFHNVLVQKNDVFMVDFDNVRVEDLYGYTPSYLLYSFVDLYDLPFSYGLINEETDRLSLLLSTLQMFCKEGTIFLTDERYGSLSEKYLLVNNILAELRRIIKQKKIKDVPLPSDLIQLKKRPF